MGGRQPTRAWRCPRLFSGQPINGNGRRATPKINKYTTNESHGEKDRGNTSEHGFGEAELNRICTTATRLRVGRQSKSRGSRKIILDSCASVQIAADKTQRNGKQREGWGGHKKKKNLPGGEVPDIGAPLGRYTPSSPEIRTETGGWETEPRTAPAKRAKLGRQFDRRGRLCWITSLVRVGHSG